MSDIESCPNIDQLDQLITNISTNKTFQQWNDLFNLKRECPKPTSPGSQGGGDPSTYVMALLIPVLHMMYLIVDDFYQKQCVIKSPTLVKFLFKAYKTVTQPAEIQMACGALNTVHNNAHIVGYYAAAFVVAACLMHLKNLIIKNYTKSEGEKNTLINPIQQQLKQYADNQAAWENDFRDAFKEIYGESQKHGGVHTTQKVFVLGRGRRVRTKLVIGESMCCTKATSSHCVKLAI